MLRPHRYRKIITFIQNRKKNGTFTLLFTALLLFIMLHFWFLLSSVNPAKGSSLQSCSLTEFYPRRPLAKSFIIDDRNLSRNIQPYSKGRPTYDYAIDGDDFQPIVTIVTAFYNADIFTAPDSVLKQSLQQIEWIIVNDGSTKHLDKLEELRKTPRVKVIDQENKKLPGARNTAIRIARAPYIFFLDSDDLIEPTYLEKAVWFLHTHPKFSLVNSWSLGFGYKEYLWKKGFHNGDQNLEENMITVALMMKTDVLREVGMFDEATIDGMEDWDLWIRTLDHGHWGHTLPEFLYWYRVSPPGKWKKIDDPKEFAAFKRALKQKYPTAYTNKVPRIPLDPPSFSLVTESAPFQNGIVKQRPRLLLVLSYADVGGSDQFNLNLVKGLTLDGWEITIAVVNAGENPMLKYYLMVTPDVFVLRNFLPFNEHPRFLAYLINSRQPDITLISNTEPTYMWLPYLRHYAPNTTYVDYVHSEVEDWKLGGYARFSIQNKQMLDRTIVASSYLANWLTTRGHDTEKVAVVRNGIDVSLFSRNESMGRIVRNEYGIPDSTTVILYVARLVEGKLPFVFAEVMKQLSDKGLDFVAFVIGSGYLENKLQNTLAEMGLLNQVIMMGSLGNEKVRNIMSAGDVIFLPTEVEALMEGMAMGLVPVSVKVGGQAELVNAENGFLINLEPNRQDMVQPFVDSLESILVNRDLLKTLSEKSVATILERFSTKRMISDMKQELCVAVGSKQREELDYTHTLLENTRIQSEFIKIQDELIETWRRNEAMKSQLADRHSSGLPNHRDPRTEYQDYLGIHSVLHQKLTAKIWSSKGPTAVPYTIFVHFRDSKGINVINADHSPKSHGTDTSTDVWKEGDIIVDTHQVDVGPAVQPGKYKLYIGWFDLKSGGRLPLVAGGDELVTPLTLEVKEANRSLGL